MVNKKVKQLNAQQKKFCKEYMIDLNATQAAIRVGYSEKTAYSSGQRLLKHAEVGKYIQKLKTKQSERTQITADKVLMDIEDTRSRAKADSDYRAELKASELQGRHLAMFVDRQQVSGDDGGPVAIRVIKEYTGEKPT